MPRTGSPCYQFSRHSQRKFKGMGITRSISYWLFYPSNSGGKITRTKSVNEKLRLTRVALSKLKLVQNFIPIYGLISARAFQYFYLRRFRGSTSCVRLLPPEMLSWEFFVFSLFGVETVSFAKIAGSSAL